MNYGGKAKSQEERSGNHRRARRHKTFRCRNCSSARPSLDPPGKTPARALRSANTFLRGKRRGRTPAQGTPRGFHGPGLRAPVGSLPSCCTALATAFLTRPDLTTAGSELAKSATVTETSASPQSRRPPLPRPPRQPRRSPRARPGPSRRGRASARLRAQSLPAASPASRRCGPSPTSAGAGVVRPELESLPALGHGGRVGARPA